METDDPQHSVVHSQLECDFARRFATPEARSWKLILIRFRTAAALGLVFSTAWSIDPASVEAQSPSATSVRSTAVVSNQDSQPQPVDAVVQRLVAQLDDDNFSLRQQAQAELLRLGDQAVPALLDAVEASPDYETIWRLKEVLLSIAIESTDPNTTTRIAISFSRNRGPCQRELATTAAMLGERLGSIRAEQALRRVQELGASVIVSGAWNQVNPGVAPRPFIGGIEEAPVLLDIEPVEKIEFDEEPSANDPFEGAIEFDPHAPVGNVPPPRQWLPEEDPIQRAQVEAVMKLMMQHGRREFPPEPGDGEEPLDELEVSDQHEPEIDEPIAIGFDGIEFFQPIGAGEGEERAEAPIMEVPPPPEMDAVPMLQLNIVQDIQIQIAPVPPEFRQIPADLVPQGLIPVMPGGLPQHGGRLGGSSFRELAEQVVRANARSAVEPAPIYDWLIGDLDSAANRFETRWLTSASSPDSADQGSNPFGRGRQIVMLNNGMVQVFDSSSLPSQEEETDKPLRYGPSDSTEPASSQTAYAPLQYVSSRWAVIDDKWLGKEEDWNLLTRIDNLVSLQINGMELTPAALEAIATCPNLTQLSLNRCRCDYRELIQALDGKSGLYVSATGTGRMGVYGGEQIDLDGCLVGQVMEQTPAARAGLQPGDRIERINGEPTPTFTHLALYVALKNPGETLTLQIRRGDRRTVVALELEERP